MKPIFLSIMLTCLSAQSCFAQNVWQDRSRLLPQKLRAVPVGLSLLHSPALVVPIKQDSVYFWKHSTEIKALIANLEFIEAGSFIWYDETGWKPNMLLNKTDFAEIFACLDGKLPQDKGFIFEKNWRWGKQAYGGDALWYILAKDKNGILYKGYGIVETEGVD